LGGIFSFFYSCPLCQEKFERQSDMENHAMSVHSVNHEGLQRLQSLINGSHWLNQNQEGKQRSKSREDLDEDEEERRHSDDQGNEWFYHHFDLSGVNAIIFKIFSPKYWITIGDFWLNLQLLRQIITLSFLPKIGENRRTFVVSISYEE
jgi:hypothetical protein